MNPNTLILGGGVTGLAAGFASGFPVLESASFPGGICSSYYLPPYNSDRLSSPLASQENYHFEIGGGHWIFGGDTSILRMIKSLTPVKQYQRKSSVYFRENDLYVPYPLQNNLRYLPDIRSQVLYEMSQIKSGFSTWQEWQTQYFGETLSELFFEPFHQLYTAGLHKNIAPQDVYKSPINLAQVIQGAFDKDVQPAGYNATFLYPELGLNSLVQKLASKADVHYGQKVVKIDLNARVVYCDSGKNHSYNNIIATLPLNRLLELTGLDVSTQADPYTSVLVLNIGAVRGSNCPNDHWLYNPDARSGFHRVGFYSNIDRNFLPQSSRISDRLVSIYVERAYLGGIRPTLVEIDRYTKEVITELQEWGYIETVEVADPTWIDVAYTWSWPNSSWRSQSLKVLEEHNIYPVGRYGRWIFQGIADSLRDGLFVGASFKEK